MIRRIFSVALLALAGVTLGCGQNTAPKITQVKETAKTPAGPMADGKKYLLASEPSGVKGVVETRKDAKDGDKIVLVGRIAGSRKPFVDGRAAFSVTDLKIAPCADDEGCPTPWDCCCTPKEELLPALAQIKFDGSDGKTLPVGAKELLGLKELAVVVVEGKASRDEKGNLTIVASGLHIRGDK